MRTRTALAALAMVTGAAAFWTAGTIGAQEVKRSHVMFTPATARSGLRVPLRCRQVLRPPLSRAIHRSPARLRYESKCLTGTGYHRTGIPRMST